MTNKNQELYSFEKILPKESDDPVVRRKKLLKIKKDFEDLEIKSEEDLAKRIDESIKEYNEGKYYTIEEVEKEIDGLLGM